MYNINQFAAAIGVSKATIRRLIRAKKLPKGIPVSPRRVTYEPEWAENYKMEQNALNEIS